MKTMKINQKEVTYKILNPGGNQTALVLGNEYTKEDIDYLVESLCQVVESLKN